MADHSYYCNGCHSTFTLSIDEGEAVPFKATCPDCGFDHAVKTFFMPVMGDSCACGKETDNPFASS